MPLTSSTATRPSATVPAVRPSRARDWARVSSPGLDPRPEQPQPDAAGDEDRGQLEQPVREDQPPEVAAVVVPGHDRADDRRGSRCSGTAGTTTGKPEHAQRQAERGDPGVVDPHLGGEVLRGVLAVVALEVVVDQLVDLGRATAGSARRSGGRAATASSPRSPRRWRPACRATTSAAGRARPGTGRRRTSRPRARCRPGCPTARLRARASSEERCATSEASGADVRTTERWVATCW